MATPESKRAAPDTSQGSSKKQMPQSSAGETYRDPAFAASSPGADALHLAQANVAFGRTMLEAIELLREAHPDNEPLGAAFTLMEPIETMLIDAVQAAERAQPAERPLAFEPNQARLLQSGEGWRVFKFEELGGTAELVVHDGRFQGGESGISIRLTGCDRRFSAIRVRGQDSAPADRISIAILDPYTDELREMVAFLHYVLNEGGEL